LSVQCATAGVVRDRSWVWLPGHLGVLTRWVPPSLVDEVVRAAGRGERRVRLLPARVVVYFVLAMVLFPECGYRRVWASLTARWPGSALADPSAAALRQARRRLGVEPLALLFDRLRGTVGTPATPGVFWRSLRLVAWDGTCVEAADSEANVARFKRHAARTTRPAGYPQLRLTALVECGTRALVDAVFGPQQYTEWPQARALLPSLQPGMLLLADRGYDGFEALRDVAATVFDPSALRLLVDVLGVENVLLGSDYPYPLGERPAGQVVRKAQFLTDADRALLLGGNAAKFLSLPTGSRLTG
jgi:hypothetical protein